jgi:hypothetical protein
MPQAPRLEPALYAGAFIGILSALPFVGWFNACCCLWVVSGGALALWLAQKNHPYPVTAADGAIVGMLAGFFGGIIAIPLNVIFDHYQRDMLMRLLTQANVEVPPQLRSAFESRPGTILTIFNGLFSSIVYGVFGLLGGLLGVAMFKKNAPPPPPPGTVEVLL